MNIREIQPRDWKAFRAARLEALQDSPYAFGATFAEESQQPEPFWRDITSRWSQDENTCFLLCENDQKQIVGMAGCYRSKQKAERSVVYSVWLHGSIRGGATASTILTMLEQWAKRNGLTHIEGYVTEKNTRARAFYSKLGFVQTNEKIPLSWDESVEEILIVKELLKEPNEAHFTEPGSRTIADGGSASGSVNEVCRRGGCVLRPMGHWSPSVHALLLHLEKAGFEYAPHFLGVEQDKECLSYIDGEVALRPWPEELLSLSGLEQIATMLTSYHEAVREFHPKQPQWHLSDREFSDGQIVRHGDLGPWNMVWSESRLVGLIDWDFSEPGTVIEDIAQAAWQCVPLKPPARTQKTGVSPDKVKERLEFFCRACGVSVKDVLQAVRVLQDLEIQRMNTHGAEGVEPWASFLKRGDIGFVQEETEWLEATFEL